MKGDALSTRHSCQNTRKARLMHFLCKGIKHLKSISGKYLMLPLRLQENNRNIELVYQVTAVSACAPLENRHLPVLPWDDPSNGWPFYSQGCSRHRAKGTRTMSAASHLLTSLLCLPQQRLERGIPSPELAFALSIILFEFLPCWMSAPAARPLCMRWEMFWPRSSSSFLSFCRNLSKYLAKT